MWKILSFNNNIVNKSILVNSNNKFIEMSKQKHNKKNGGKTNGNLEQPKDGFISEDKSKDILLNILAKPGAKQNKITEITIDGVGVQINAPPTDGEANTELLKYISSILGLRKSDVHLEKEMR
nr:UPF0235 protein C15orf40 homolog isoform X2 [Onthophagus taurus]